MLPPFCLGQTNTKRDEPSTSASELTNERRQWAQNALTTLSLEEKVGQILQVRYYADYGDFESTEYRHLREELQKSLSLMPDFGPAQELMGFFEMVQGDHLTVAEQYLQRAILLEPENPSYLFSLAQLQLRNHNADAARRTLQPLLLPNVDPKLHAQADEMIQEIADKRPAN